MFVLILDLTTSEQLLRVEFGKGYDLNKMGQLDQLFLQQGYTIAQNLSKLPALVLIEYLLKYFAAQYRHVRLLYHADA